MDPTKEGPGEVFFSMTLPNGRVIGNPAPKSTTARKTRTAASGGTTMPGAPRGVAVKNTDATLITINLQDITGRDSGDQVARELQKIARIAQYADAARVSLRARIINQLREEGLDYNGRMAWILGSDAVRTANSVVQPLGAIAMEADNLYRNAMIFETRLQTLVWDPIKLARESRGRQTSLGLDV